MQGVLVFGEQELRELLALHDLFSDFRIRVFLRFLVLGRFRVSGSGFWVSRSVTSSRSKTLFRSEVTLWIPSSRAVSLVRYAKGAPTVMLLGPSFRALSGRLKFTVRRHKLTNILSPLRPGTFAERNPRGKYLYRAWPRERERESDSERESESEIEVERERERERDVVPLQSEARARTAQGALGGHRRLTRTAPPRGAGALGRASQPASVHFFLIKFILHNAFIKIHSVR